MRLDRGSLPLTFPLAGWAECWVLLQGGVTRFLCSYHACCLGMTRETPAHVWVPLPMRGRKHGCMPRRKLFVVANQRRLRSACVSAAVGTALQTAVAAWLRSGVIGDIILQPDGRLLHRGPKQCKWTRTHTWAFHVLIQELVFPKQR